MALAKRAHSIDVDIEGRLVGHALKLKLRLDVKMSARDTFYHQSLVFRRSAACLSWSALRYAPFGRPNTCMMKS